MTPLAVHRFRRRHATSPLDPSTATILYVNRMHAAHHTHIAAAGCVATVFTRSL